MSFVRASEKMRFSDHDDALYVFLNTGHIEDYGELDPKSSLNNPEVFCEVMFRVLDQAGIDIDLEMVNKVRERLHLEPLDSIGDSYETREDFEDFMEELEEEMEDE